MNRLPISSATVARPERTRRRHPDASTAAPPFRKQQSRTVEEEGCRHVGEEYLCLQASYRSLAKKRAGKVINKSASRKSINWLVFGLRRGVGYRCLCGLPTCAATTRSARGIRGRPIRHRQPWSRRWLRKWLGRPATRLKALQLLRG
jgi:hypothetical protein